VHMDLEKEWIQLRFFINDEEVEMAMRYWQDNWKIPVITKEIPKGNDVGEIFIFDTLVQWELTD
jgi:hypothetical protein